MSITESTVQNSYDDRIQDHRIIINYGKTKVTIYVATLMGRYYLETLTTKENLPLFDGTHLIGLTADELKAILGVPTDEIETKIAYWCDESFGQGFVFTFSDGKSSSVTWYNGIDGIDH